MYPAYEAEPLGRADDEMEMDTDAIDAGEDELLAQRAQIEQTRAEMSSTIDAIKEKLNPQVLMDQAKETVHEATEEMKHRAYDATVGRAQEAVGTAVHTVRDAGESIVDTIKRNPMPAALIAVGVGWLLMENRRTSGYRHEQDMYPVYDRDAYYPRSETHREYRGHEGGYTGRAYGRDRQDGPGIRERVGDAVGTVREKAGDMAHTIREKASDMAGTVRERASDMTGRVQERTSEMRTDLRDRAGDAAERARYQASLAKMEARRRAEDASDAWQRTTNENPLLAGVICMGLGMAVGMALPATQREHEMMGETRDRLADQAKDAAQNVAQKVQTVAANTMDTVKETVKETVTQEARNQGLMGGQQGSQMSGGMASGGGGMTAGSGMSGGTAGDLGLTGSGSAMQGHDIAATTTTGTGTTWPEDRGTGEPV